METLFNSPLLGIGLCLVGYLIGVVIQKKTGSVICNPILIAAIFCIIVMKLFDISLAQFNEGALIVQLFITPATCVLALSIYRQRVILKEYFLPVVCGCSMGALVSMISAYVLCTIFQLDEMVTAAVLPKSVTTAIAVELSAQLGGLVPITILCVMITGIAGAIFGPYLAKVLHITNPVEVGVALGTSAHVIGTTKAVELGEIQGAMSSVAIGITGLATLFLCLLL